MTAMIKSFDVVVAFPRETVLFVGAHPLYREHEEGEVMALIYSHKAETPFGGPQSRHAMFIVRYADGHELFVPVAKYNRYRIFFAGDDLEGLQEDDSIVLTVPPMSMFFERLNDIGARGEVSAIVYERREGKLPRAAFQIDYPDIFHSALVPVSKHETYRVWFD